VRDTVEVTPELLEALAQVAGMKIPKADQDRLRVALQDHLMAMASIEEQLDLLESQPIVQLDPRWQ
jgi:hypothetical protein